MRTTPRVSVQMPAYNTGRYIGAAIDSVLAQTFGDFELIVIDDGSTDDTAAIVESYRDTRIRLVRNPVNEGLPKTRALGVTLSQGEYLAFLDSDDLAHPGRLERQVGFLDRHPTCAVVGGWARMVDSEGRPCGLIRKPTGTRRIQARLLFGYCFKNTTVMARRSIVQRYGFRPQFHASSDADLWVRVGLENDVQNLRRVLATYREHHGGISKRASERTRAARVAIIAEQLERLAPQFDEKDALFHYAVCRPEEAPRTRDFIERTADWLERLRAVNRKVRIYPDPQFTRAVGEQWLRVCLTIARSPWEAMGYVRSWPLASWSLAALMLDTGAVFRHVGIHRLQGASGMPPRTPTPG